MTYPMSRIDILLIVVFLTIALTSINSPAREPLNQKNGMVRPEPLTPGAANTILEVPDAIHLQNRRISVSLCPQTARIVGIKNLITQETIFVKTDNWRFDLSDARLSSDHLPLLTRDSGNDQTQYVFENETYRVTVQFHLPANAAFAQRHISISRKDKSAFWIKEVVPLQLSLASPEMDVNLYEHQACATCFVRGQKGGIVLGPRIPYQYSYNADGWIHFSFPANLKIPAQEVYALEPVFFGVYGYDQYGAVPASPLSESHGYRPAPWKKPLLVSESLAMVEMTESLFGPPTAQLDTKINGWMAGANRVDYGPEPDDEKYLKDWRLIQIADAAGVDMVTGGTMWTGCWPHVQQLTQGQVEFPFPPDLQRLIAAARDKDILLGTGGSIINGNPWSDTEGIKNTKGTPYRPDQPEWLLHPPLGLTHPWIIPTVFQGNCLANRPFRQWLAAATSHQINKSDGVIGFWAHDEHAFGSGAGAVCLSPNHDHLPGNIDYANWRGIMDLVKRITQHCPGLITNAGRPDMDIGVWAIGKFTCVFTIHEESRQIEEAMWDSDHSWNRGSGNRCRVWARVRRYHHFFPHFRDEVRTEWLKPDHDGIDYNMLSALAVSPSMVLYLPDKTPPQTLARIHRWLDWGRAHIDYLNVRVDLPVWPGEGQVDGYAHILKDHGYIFLFNPNASDLPTQFSLNETIGLTSGQEKQFQIKPIHPQELTVSPFRNTSYEYGDLVTLYVPARKAMLLEIMMK